MLTHLSRIDSDTYDFTITGNTCLTRALLETECRFFNNTEEVNFVEGCEDFDVSLSSIENSILFLDKRACCIKRGFSSAHNYREAQDTLKSCNVKCHVQCEAHKSE